MWEGEDLGSRMYEGTLLGRIPVQMTKMRVQISNELRQDIHDTMRQYVGKRLTPKHIIIDRRMLGCGKYSDEIFHFGKFKFDYQGIKIEPRINIIGQQI